MSVILLNGNHAIKFDFKKSIYNTNTYYKSYTLNKIKYNDKIYVITNIRTGKIKDNSILWFNSSKTNKQAPNWFVKDLILNNKLMEKILKSKELVKIKIK